MDVRIIYEDCPRLQHWTGWFPCLFSWT